MLWLDGVCQTIFVLTSGRNVMVVYGLPPGLSIFFGRIARQILKYLSDGASVRHLINDKS